MKIDADGVVQSHFMRTQYNYDSDAVSRETALRCLDPTRTQQQFKEECDINVILERFGVTGTLPMNAYQPMTGDFTNVEGDFHTALLQIEAANNNFMRLPAKVRERFNNEPQKFVDFCVDPANIEAVRELNLAPRPAAPALTEIVKNGSE